MDHLGSGMGEMVVLLHADPAKDIVIIIVPSIKTLFIFIVMFLVSIVVYELNRSCSGCMS
jgi:uncharacterized membrane protein YqhA